MGACRHPDLTAESNSGSYLARLLATSCGTPLLSGCFPCKPPFEQRFQKSPDSQQACRKSITAFLFSSSFTGTGISPVKIFGGSTPAFSKKKQFHQKTPDLFLITNQVIKDLILLLILLCSMIITDLAMQ